MHLKLQKIRTYLELKENQISSLINISCYKYKRYEKGNLEITVESLFLLALLYNIPLDYLVYTKYSVDEIIEKGKLKELLQIPPYERLQILEKNLCLHSSYKNYSSSNYRVTRNISENCILNFSENLYTTRTNTKTEINTISNLLGISDSEYLRFEQGKSFPTSIQAIKIAEIFNLSIHKLFEKN